jgi:preprotein translocase subunit YajC
MVSVAWAQAAGESPFDGLGMLLPFVLVFVVFYFLLIRPQQKKVKAHQQKLSTIAKGDDVVTGGGFYGRVLKAEGDDLLVRLGEGTEGRVLRSTVMDKLEKGESPVKMKASSPKKGARAGDKALEKVSAEEKGEEKPKRVSKKKEKPEAAVEKGDEGSSEDA